MFVKPPLSGLEQEVMKTLWSRGKATATDIQTALMPERILKDSTVRTVLTRLEDKDYVRHEVDGRTFLYSSVEPPRSLAVSAVKQILDRFCQGSVESLLVGMVENEIVDSHELQAIVDRLSTQSLDSLGKSSKKRDRKK